LQRQLKEHNRQLEDSNAELEMFTATVAHSLQNPLGTMFSISSTLLDTGPQAPGFAAQAAELLPIVRDSSEHMIHAVNALLLLGNIRSQTLPEMQPLKPGKVAKQALQSLQALVKEKRAEIIWEGWPWQPITSYTPWIHEVWLNYLSNALKYGGTPPKLWIGATRQGTWQEYWVRDNGPGLSAKEQDSLFTPFTRLHPHRAEGSGLGLYVARRIVQRLGGEVGVESVSGQGCRFYFRLSRQ